MERNEKFCVNVTLSNPGSTSVSLKNSSGIISIEKGSREKLLSDAVFAMEKDMDMVVTKIVPSREDTRALLSSMVNQISMDPGILGNPSVLSSIVTPVKYDIDRKRDIEDISMTLVFDPAKLAEITRENIFEKEH